MYVEVSEWLSCNANWLIIQLYHDRNKLHYEEKMSALYKIKHASLLKQQPACKHVSQLGRIFQILSQPVFALTP